jgi:hypothetical protein
VDFWRDIVARNYRCLTAYLVLLIVFYCLNLPLAEKKLAFARAYVPGNAEVKFALGNLRLAPSIAARSIAGTKGH